MKTYVISHLQEFRSEELLKYLLDFKIPFENVQDVDHSFRKIHPGNVEVTRSLLKRDMTNAEYSCAFAHLAAIESFLGSGSTVALILEDDAIPLRDFHTEIDFVENSNKAIISQLHTNVYSKFRLLKRLPLLKPVDGAYAYLLNRQAATIIFNAVSKSGVLVPADWHFPAIRGLCVYTSLTAKFAHPESRSDSYIEKERSALIEENYLSESKIRRRIGLEDYAVAKKCGVPFSYFFEYRVRTYIQEIWIKKFFYITKSFM